MAAPEEVLKGLAKLESDVLLWKNKNLGSQDGIDRAALKTEKVAEFSEHSRLVVQFIGETLTFVLQYDDIALKNPELMSRDLHSIFALTLLSNQMSLKLRPVTNYSWAELALNAREGSLPSQARMKEFQAGFMVGIIHDWTTEFMQRELQADPDKLAAQSAKETQLLAKEAEELSKKAFIYQRRQQKIYDDWKASTKAMERYEALDEKLNDLILKNDRAGVRKMIETYLPWPLMEPSEIKLWQVWLEAIEHPDPKNTTFAFRGVNYNTDKIQRLKLSNGEERIGFMSTVLTKNQGNYTRRLRSLNTSRQHNGDFAHEKGKVFVGKISDQFRNHAEEPKASSFLSFTLSPGRAKVFTAQSEGEKNGGGLLAVRVDSRRLVPNIMSNFGAEFELLAPLIIFPDEVAIYVEEDKLDFQEFLKRVSKMTGVDYTARGNVEKVYDSFYQSQGRRFFQQISKPLGPQGALRCEKVF